MYTGKVAVILSAAKTMQLILLLNTASGRLCRKGEATYKRDPLIIPQR